MSINFYSILNVQPDVSAVEIKTAYRKMLRKAHPDTGGNAQLFMLVQKSYEILGNKNSRANYDSSLRTAGLYNMSASENKNATRSQQAKEAYGKAEREKPVTYMANVNQSREETNSSKTSDKFWIFFWIIIVVIIDSLIINSGPSAYNTSDTLTTKILGYHLFIYTLVDVGLLIPALINRAIVYKYREIKLNETATATKTV